MSGSRQSLVTLVPLQSYLEPFCRCNREMQPLSFPRCTPQIELRALHSFHFLSKVESFCRCNHCASRMHILSSKMLKLR